MCLTPLTLVRDYKTIDGQLTDIVPCGKCPECLRRRQQAWTFRLLQELKVSTSALFFNMTYEFPPIAKSGYMTLSKRDWQLFMKKLRKRCSKVDKNAKLKYYMCGEYGGKTQRPHYHAIVFNIPRNFVNHPDIITAIWGHGHCMYGEVNQATCNYVSKYMMKGTSGTEHCKNTGEADVREREFSLMSKKLGMSFITPQMVTFLTENMYCFATMPGGAKIALPRYFRDKIFSKPERKILAEMFAKDRENYERFRSFAHEVAYIKDSYRKAEKEQILHRQKL